MSEIIWTSREEAFLDFWEKCTRPADASEVGLSRNAFAAGMAAATHFERAETWRCFHCDEVFTDNRSAGLHFGMDQCSDPACKIKMGAEGSLVTALRRAEAELADAWAAIHNESTEAAKAYYSQQYRHGEQLRATEELGYERGIRDARAEVWQPIDRIVPADGLIVIGYGEYRERDGFSPAFMRWYAEDNGWTVNGMPFYPTHWMPLFAAPKGGT